MSGVTLGGGEGGKLGEIHKKLQKKRVRRREEKGKKNPEGLDGLGEVTKVGNIWEYLGLWVPAAVGHVALHVPERPSPRPCRAVTL